MALLYGIVNYFKNFCVDARFIGERGRFDEVFCNFTGGGEGNKI